MRYKSYLALFICLLTLSCDDAIDPDTSGKFIKFYGGADDETAYAVEEIPGEGFIIVGSTDLRGDGNKDVFIIGTDINGNRKWQKSYGSQSPDEGKAIKASSDGNFFVLGYTIKNSFKDFYLLKIDQQGDTAFTTTFGLPNRHEEGIYLQPTIKGGLSLIGNVVDTLDNSKDVYLVKTNSDGKTSLYERLYGLPGRTDSVGTIVEADNADLVWCGTFKRDNVFNMRIVKSDEFGNLKWDFPFNEENSPIPQNASGLTIQKVNGNGYIAIGTIETGQNSDIFLVRITENGERIWSQIINDPNHPEANETGAYVYPTSDGGFVVAGTIFKSETDSDIILMKVDDQGNPQWATPQTFGGDGKDTGTFVKETADGGFVILGTVTIFNNTAISLIKTDVNGKIPGK